MKKLILIFCILGMGKIAFAQTNTFPSSGNVGIGTVTPTATLEVYKAGDSYVKVHSGADNYSYLHLTDGTSSGYLIKNNTGSAGNGASVGGLYTYIDAGYDYQHFEGSSPRLTIKSGGNVGVGTISPDTKFHIKGSNNMLKIENINTSSNQYAQMNLKAGTADNYIWSNNQNSPGFYGGSSALNIYTGQDSPIAFFTNGTNERMRIDGAGNIAIGTTDPQGYKLAVNGNMIAESVKVKLHGSWPDYVFKNNYSLQTLPEVEKYIQINKHLPGIPSEEQVKKEGLDLGEMNAKLLQKIEELTLYLIEQNKEIKEQRTMIKDLQQEAIQLKFKK